MNTANVIFHQSKIISLHVVWYFFLSWIKNNLCLWNSAKNVHKSTSTTASPRKSWYLDSPLKICFWTNTSHAEPPAPHPWEVMLHSPSFHWQIYCLNLLILSFLPCRLWLYKEVALPYFSPAIALPHFPLRLQCFYSEWGALMNHSLVYSRNSTCKCRQHDSKAGWAEQVQLNLVEVNQYLQSSTGRGRESTNKSKRPKGHNSNIDNLAYKCSLGSIHTVIID